jgi:hypothetical protein
MRRDGMAAALIGGLALILVLAGFAVVGGPAQGRMERRNDARVEDLRRLVDCVGARYNDSGVVLPQSLDGLIGCQRSVRFADPYTGEPYRYERRSDRDFAICATFEQPGRVRRLPGFVLDAETGCMTLNS